MYEMIEKWLGFLKEARTCGYNAGSSSICIAMAILVLASVIKEHQ